MGHLTFMGTANIHRWLTAGWVTSSVFLGWTNMDKCDRRVKGSNYASAYAGEGKGKTADGQLKKLGCRWHPFLSCQLQPVQGTWPQLCFNRLSVVMLSLTIAQLKLDTETFVRLYPRDALGEKKSGLCLRHNKSSLRLRF